MKNAKLVYCLPLLCAYSPLGLGALINLSQTLLFLANPLPPNVIFSLDDAGPMDYEMMADPYWEACAYDPKITGTLSSVTSCGSNINNIGIFKGFDGSKFHYFSYFYHNTDNTYNDTCGLNNDQSSVESCTTLTDWRAYSSDLNLVYYNPSISYTPWKGPCYTNGGACTNGNFSAALSYPVQGTPGYSLSRNLAGSQYNVWIDNKGYSGSRPLRASLVNVTTGANGQIDLWDSYITVVLNATNAQVYSTTFAPTASGMNPTTTLQATLTNTSTCYNVLGSSSLVRSIFNGALSYTSTNGNGCMSVAQAQVNFANWYQYNRRRSFVARNAISQVVALYPTFRFGLNVSHQVNPFMVDVPPLPPQDYTSYNLQLLKTLFNYPWQPQPSKLRFGLDNIGIYYRNLLPQAAINPITYSCQQNYAVLLSGGYWDDNYNFANGDVDGDGISPTLADVARYYYITDLSPLPNNVAPNAWDPATWQHMVTFTVGLGVRGNLVSGTDGWPNPPKNLNSSWGNPFTDPVAQIDDMWHAAFNSKGFFFGAQNPSTLTNAFNTILANIAQRTGSASSVAQNSTVLNTTSQVYQGLFNTNNWQGDLIAYPISLQGVLASVPSWSASCVLTGGVCTRPAGSNPGISPDSRVIVTRNWTGENSGIAFRWPSDYSAIKVNGNLPTNLTNFLSNAPYPANTTTGSQIAANQAYGQALLNYLRGNRSNEAQNNAAYSFRNRTSILGDIINSSPVYVANPNRVYQDSLESAPYSSFAQTYANRTPIVYVGANDGMLHGFRASDGQELLAYIPGNRDIYTHLPSLSLIAYPHYFYVDGDPSVGDVFLSGAWRTILVDNLRNGGQGIFALNITNPANFSESAASQIYLWEFSDQDDPDVGYIQGSVTIAKVRTGTNQSKWAVIFGNGYNNSQADGYASTTGKAALYILFIEQGINGTWVADSGYIKIPVGTGSTTTPNGLAEPSAVDINADYIVDYVYAGDLQGNIWKFDLTDNTPANWKSKASILFTASNTAAGDQPITAPLVVGQGPTGIQNGVMIYFGTGKFLEISDNTPTNQTTQSFYGIWDQLQGATVTKSQLVQQQILGQVTSGSLTYRLVTNNAVNYNTTPSPQNKGWYLNLIELTASSNNGERVVSQPLLRGGNVIFTTLVPTTDPCNFGGSSWLMEVNALSGGTAIATPFDVNNDGTFGTADYLTLNASGKTYKQAPAGVMSSVGLTGTPAVFLSPDKEKETKVLSGSQGIGTVTENVGSLSGRQNWRQLYH